jgi:hypothetical protein
MQYFFLGLYLLLLGTFSSAFYFIFAFLDPDVQSRSETLFFLQIKFTVYIINCAVTPEYFHAFLIESVFFQNSVRLR